MNSTETIVTADTNGNITRPPNRSVSAPTGIRPRDPTTTGTATKSATSDSDSDPSVPFVRNNGPSGLNNAHAQKFTAKPTVAIASISPGLPKRFRELTVAAPERTASSLCDTYLRQLPSAGTLEDDNPLNHPGRPTGSGVGRGWHLPSTCDPR